MDLVTVTYDHQKKTLNFVLFVAIAEAHGTGQ